MGLVKLICSTLCFHIHTLVGLNLKGMTPGFPLGLPFKIGLDSISFKPTFLKSTLTNSWMLTADGSLTLLQFINTSFSFHCYHNTSIHYCTLSVKTVSALPDDSFLNKGLKLKSFPAKESFHSCLLIKHFHINDISERFFSLYS